MVNEEDIAPVKSGNKVARQYQLDLLEHAMQRNTIIYLPTGAGKTYVAILALRRYSDQMQESPRKNGKRALFLTTTVELARQQAVELRKYTNLKVGLYIGERDVDNWEREDWESEIDKNQVLCGTAQVFVNIVSTNILKISDLCLVVCDECHNVTGGHPMMNFLRFFQFVPQEQHPRLIGLTGVLLKVATVNNIQFELKRLETTFRGVVATVARHDYHNVMMHSTNPLEVVLTYEDHSNRTKIVDLMKLHVQKIIKRINNTSLGKVPTKLTKGLVGIRQPSKQKYLSNLLKDFIFQLENLGIYGGQLALTSISVDIEVKFRQAETAGLRALYRTITYMIDHMIHILSEHMNRIKKEHNLTDTRLIQMHSTPKVNAVLDYIMDRAKGKTKDDIHCLLFVERRYTAKCLYLTVSHYIALVEGLSQIVLPYYIVGRSSLNIDLETAIERTVNKSVVDRFRQRSLNFLICSSVLEEGIDVPACSDVISFDKIKTFSSFIQIKGRARKANSTFTILCAVEEHDETLQKIEQFNTVHGLIKQFLWSRVIEEIEDPTENEIAEHFSEGIESFTSKEGARLLPGQALTTLYRYCIGLPTDMFSVLSPWFERQPGHIVSVRMPMPSKVKHTIYSEPKNNVKMAKVSAAMKACKELYLRGELNEKLLPVSNEECIASVADELFSHWKKYNDHVGSTINNTRSQVYDNLCPEQLYNSMPRVGEPAYAYTLQITADFHDNDYTEHIIEFLKSQRTYAILLRKRLPKLAEIPLFMNQGKIRAKISSEPLPIVVSSSESLQELRNYHSMIFRDILKSCWKPYLVNDSRDKENSFLVVPITNGNIDWGIVRQFQRLPKFKIYTVEERKKMVHRPEDYIGRVVSKWYSSEEDRFIVTRVLNKTPESPFDDARFESFKHFAESRYGSVIDRVVQTDQFLIEVRALTKKRSFYAKGVVKKGETNATSKITLIPELCFNTTYPADLWLKAIFVPNIIHRVYNMLHAEALRVRINSFLGIKSYPYEPLPLIADQSLARACDDIGTVVEEREKVKPTVPVLRPEKVSKIVEFKPLLEQASMWKAYELPLAKELDVFNVHTVEIDYFCNFLAGKINESLQKEIQDQFKEDWTGSRHLEIQKRKQRPSNYVNGEVASSSGLRSLTDVARTEKMRIKILDITTNNGEMRTGELRDFLAAITTTKCGDMFDMERFELLGDSFLKFSASLYLANKYPTHHEGHLTEIKSKLISNKNLLYCMLDTDIPQRICSKMFNIYEWLPPGVSLPKKLFNWLHENLPNSLNISISTFYPLQLKEEDIKNGDCAEDALCKLMAGCNLATAPLPQLNTTSEISYLLNKERLFHKTVADTLEALLGVCVQNYGIYKSFEMLDFFGICKSEPGKPVTGLLGLELGSRLLRANILSAEVDKFLCNHKSLEKNLGYTFKDRAYLLQALTHPSFPTNRITGCYQELEFIGDAILDFLISAYIFEQHKEMNPGKLTDLRSALVNNVTLACICVRHRFHLFLLAENAILADAIKSFDDFQESHNFVTSDLVEILLEENLVGKHLAGKWNFAKNVDVPKALGDILEALIAAVYLDSRDLSVTWRVIYNLFEDELDAFSKNVPIDPVRELHENTAADIKWSAPEIEDAIVMIKCYFNCQKERMEVHGFGTNTKQAKKAAAKHALQIMKKHQI